MKETSAHLRFSNPCAPVDLTFTLADEMIRKAQRNFKAIVTALPFLRRYGFRRCESPVILPRTGLPALSEIEKGSYGALPFSTDQFSSALMTGVVFRITAPANYPPRCLRH
jgi:hypothetical protein